MITVLDAYVRTRVFAATRILLYGDNLELARIHGKRKIQEWRWLTSSNRSLNVASDISLCSTSPQRLGGGEDDFWRNRLAEGPRHEVKASSDGVVSFQVFGTSSVVLATNSHDIFNTVRHVTSHQGLVMNRAI